MVLVLLLFFLLSPTFTIHSIRVSRQDQRVDIEELQQLLRPSFGKHLFFLSSPLVERRILATYPEVSAAAIRKRYPRELSVTLYMDPVVAEVLVGKPGETEEALHGSGAFTGERERWSYLTARGIYLDLPFPLPFSSSPRGHSPQDDVLEEAARGERALRIHLVDWAVKPTHQQYLLPPEALQDIQTIQQILEESFGHTVAFVTLYLRAREFHVQTEQLALWFDRGLPLVQQFEHYRAFLRALPPGSAQRYVDLRMHDRVVYQ
jgi:hypothetical protein